MSDDSDFYIVSPFDIDSTSVTASNVAHTETEWTAGTYSLGEVRRYGDFVYEVVADPSTTDRPDVGAVASPATWLQTDVAAPLRMFDDYIANGSNNLDSIDVTIGPFENPESIALFGLSGQTLQIIATSGGVTTYDETITLQDWSAITDWYQFYFAPVIQLDKVVRLDIPPYPDTTIQVIITGAPGSSVSCGECVVGALTGLGLTLEDTEIGIGSYSTRYEDTFGIVRVIERDSYETAGYRVLVDASTTNAVKNAMFARKSKPTIFVGSKDSPEFILYGFYEDMRITAGHLTAHTMKLDVVGLT